jgi:transposase
MRFYLTDEEWAVLEPLLPAKRKTATVDDRRIINAIKDDGAVSVIPSRSNATKRVWCPKRIYRLRHKVENYFCDIKDWRRIATRYDKACSQLFDRKPYRSGALLDQVMSPDPSTRRGCNTPSR